MKNTVAFGLAIRRERGSRKQTEIAELGGPYRQLQAKIEHGADIEVKYSVLAQYDTAFGWASGTAASILGSTEAAALPFHPCAGTLGHDASTGRPIDVPERLKTTLAPEQLIPVIAAWPGIAVIDTEVFDLPAERAELEATRQFPKWRETKHNSTGPTVAQLVSEWKAVSPDRTAVASGVLHNGAERVAIDPLPLLTNSREASALVRVVNGINATIPEGTHNYMVAWTLLFLASQSRKPSSNPGVHTERLTVDRFLLPPENSPQPAHRGFFGPAFEPLTLSWQEWLPDEPLRFEPTFDIAARLFSGLNAARSESITIELDKSTTPAGSFYEGPSIVFPQQLSDATMVLHNADISPELPAVIAWATRTPVLVVGRSPVRAADSKADYHLIEVMEPPHHPDEQPTVATEKGTALLSQIAGAQLPLLTFSADADGVSSSVVLRAAGDRDWRSRP